MKISVKYIMRQYFQGRITDSKDWERKLLCVCKKWLLHTPILPFDDKKSFIKKVGKQSIQVWQEASLYLGLRDYYEREHEESVLRILQSYISQSLASKKINAADYGLLAYALLEQNDSQSITLEFLRYVEENITESGMILYKPNVNNCAFVDTLGFVCPFLVKYGLKNNKQEYVDLAKKQIEKYLEYGVEKKSGLPFHAFMIEEKIPLGICDWARGLAWLLIALMESYICIIKTYKEDDFFKVAIKKYADILVQLQRESGAFSWQLLARNCDSDSSAVAVFGWYLANCAEIFGNNEYKKRARKCRDFLMSVTYNNGVIDFCQGDTIRIGVYSRNFDRMPFAQGYALRLQEKLSYE